MFDPFLCIITNDSYPNPFVWGFPIINRLLNKIHQHNFYRNPTFPYSPS